MLFIVVVEKLHLENSLEEIGRYISSDTIYYQFLCITDCDKTGVSLQQGETVAYRWIPEKEYILFVNSSDMIPIQKVRYADFLKKLGYIHQQIPICKGLGLSQQAKTRGIFRKGYPFPMLATELLQSFSAIKISERNETERRQQQRISSFML